MAKVTALAKEQLFINYMRAVGLIGGGVLAVAAYNLPLAGFNWDFYLFAAVTIVIGSRMVVDIPRFKTNISVSDVFIIATMLLYGGEAAVVLAGCEAYCTSLRFTKQFRFRAFNAAVMACSIYLVVRALEIIFGQIQQLHLAGISSKLLAAMCVIVAVHYTVNSGLMAVASALRKGRSVWQTWREYYLWTFITYMAEASAAVITVNLIDQFGILAFVVASPVVSIIYFTYSTYHKNVEASAAQAEQAIKHMAALEESEKRFRSAFDYATIGMALVAPDGSIVQVNRSLCEILGHTADDLIGKQFHTFARTNDLGAFLVQAARIMSAQSESHQMEMCFHHKDGHEVWAFVGISMIHNVEDHAARLIVQVQNITDRKRAEERLLHDALHDALTGLANRALFLDHLKQAIERARRYSGQTFAVLFIDIDRFKLINDSIGHLAGDRMLIEISDRLRRCLRPGDTVARLGGDEFTILVEDISDVVEAISVVERVQKEISLPINLDGHETTANASIGIAVYNLDYERPEDLLRDADTAMYQAKASGKARYVIFDKHMHARALHLLQLENDLRRATEQQEMFIVYQPIVSLETARLVGFEALVRWLHPERGLINPSEFITVAEETGHIVPLGEYVLEQACRQMQQWTKEYPGCEPLTISVNLSGKQIARGNITEQILDILNRTELNPRQLKIEITESVVMENIEAATSMLEQLRSLGVQLSIDDFGTGYSSLSYLRRLPIDTLKVDRSFITNMVKDKESAEIVYTIIMLAKNLGLAVIAEGVETQEQLEMLQRHGCDNGQGYLFSKPLSANAAEEMVKRMTESKPVHSSIAPRPAQDHSFLFAKYLVH